MKPDEPEEKPKEEPKEVTFAGRYAPKTEHKKAFFHYMQSIYGSVTYKARRDGKIVDPQLSPHRKCNLQKDFWSFVKDAIGDSTDTDRIDAAAHTWVSQRFVGSGAPGGASGVCLLCRHLRAISVGALWGTQRVSEIMSKRRVRADVATLGTRTCE